MIKTVCKSGKGQIELHYSRFFNHFEGKNKEVRKICQTKKLFSGGTKNAHRKM